MARADGETRGKFGDMGIRFETGTMGHEEKVWNFMAEEFIPDEPVGR